MRSSTKWRNAALAAALLLRLPLIVASPLPAPQVAGPKVVEVPLYNEGTLYSANITIGSPPQHHSIWVDTGSADTWIKSSSFDMKSSHTAWKVSDGSLEITYSDGSHISGGIVRDDFGIGGVVVKGMTVGLQKTGGLKNKISKSGILALGPLGSRDNDISNRGLMEKLVKQGSIATRTISLWLDHGGQKPSMILGGYDRSKYQGNLTVFPLQPHAEMGMGFYLTTPDGMSRILVPVGFNKWFMMDSGSSESVLPPSAIDKIVAALRPHGLVEGHDRDSYVAPCDVLNLPGGLDLAFLSGRSSDKEPSYRIRFRDLFHNSREGRAGRLHLDPGMCSLGVVKGNAENGVFGLSQQFLRTVYTVTNLDQRTVAFAQAIDDAGETTDVREIEAGEPFWQL